MIVITPDPLPDIRQPEKWVILQVTNDAEVMYYLFTATQGQTPGSERCKMSSGSDSMDAVKIGSDGSLIWPQLSGSTYLLNPFGQGLLGNKSEKILKQIIAVRYPYFQIGSLVERLELQEDENGSVIYPLRPKNVVLN